VSTGRVGGGGPNGHGSYVMMSMPNRSLYGPVRPHSPAATTVPAESTSSVRSNRSATASSMMRTRPDAIRLVGVTGAADHGRGLPLTARSAYGVPSVRGPNASLHDRSARAATNATRRMRMRYRPRDSRWDRGAPAWSPPAAQRLVTEPSESRP